MLNRRKKNNFHKKENRHPINFLKLFIIANNYTINTTLKYDENTYLKFFF